MILEKIKENKKKFMVIILALFVVSLYFFNISWVPRYKSKVDFIYFVNFDNDKEVSGMSKNIFIGRVNERKGQVENGFIYTRFNVRVLKNIKGDLKGDKNILQMGGYDGVYELEPDKGGFVKKNKVYLFILNGEKIISHPSAHKEIVNNSEKYSDVEIMNSKITRKVLDRYIEAYRNEVYNISDMINNNLKNSYKKFTDKERQEWVSNYFRKEKEKDRKNIINEYKSHNMKISNSRLEKEIEEIYKDIDTRILKTGIVEDLNKEDRGVFTVEEVDKMIKEMEKKKEIEDEKFYKKN